MWGWSLIPFLNHISEDSMDETAEAKETLFHYFQVASNWQLDITHQDEIESLVDSIIEIAVQRAFIKMTSEKKTVPTRKAKETK